MKNESSFSCVWGKSDWSRVRSRVPSSSMLHQICVSLHTLRLTSIGLFAAHHRKLTRSACPWGKKTTLLLNPTWKMWCKRNSKTLLKQRTPYLLFVYRQFREEDVFFGSSEEHQLWIYSSSRLFSKLGREATTKQDETKGPIRHTQSD